MSEIPNEPQVPPAEDQLRVPMRDVVAFVRQLSHDLRNHLNAAELQSAFLHELAGDQEARTELQRLRGMLSEIGCSLQRLTDSLAPIKLTRMPYEADAFVQDLVQKLEQKFPEQCGEVDWTTEAGSALLDIDPQILQQAFQELFANAFQHSRHSGRLTATAHIKKDEFVFTLREPKDNFAGSTEKWGQEPFKRVSHGHYGLGLLRVRHIVEAHGGCLQVRYDQPSSSLVTTVALPLAEKE